MMEAYFLSLNYWDISAVPVEEITDTHVTVLIKNSYKCKVSRFGSDGIYFKTLAAAKKTLMALTQDNEVKDA